MTNDYRSEINGLRAIAIIGVIFFHADSNFLLNGYLGVDLFFVISGYLMASIVFSNSKQNYNILEFLFRRAKRILPLYFFLLLLFFLILSIIVNLENIRENNIQSFLSSIVFLNNILMFLKLNYFSVESNFSAFLHLWSLSIEVQYYIFFALAVFVLFNKNEKLIKILFVMLFFLFFIYFLFINRLDKSASFYLIQNRLWEFLLGSITFFIYKDNELKKKINFLSSNFFTIFFLILIVFSFFKLENIDPLYNKIVLVFSTSLILISTKNNNLIYNLLTNKLLIFIGIISYSLYLWHNFLFVTYRLIIIEEPTFYEYFILFFISLILSSLTWKYIEVPFRKKTISFKKLSAFFFICIILSLLIINFSKKNDLKYLNKIIDMNFKDRNLLHEKKIPSLNKTFNNFDDKNILIVGDSYARDIINVFYYSEFINDINLSYLNIDIMCNKISNNKILNNNIKKSSIIILSYKYINLNCYNEDLLSLTQNNQKIIIVGTKNFGYNINAILFLNSLFNKENRNIKLIKKINDQYLKEKKIIDKNIYLNFVDLISDDDNNIIIYDNNKKLLSVDKYHLTENGIKYLSDKIISNMQNLLKKQ